MLQSCNGRDPQDGRILQLLTASLSSIALLIFCGCDQVGDLVDEAQEQVDSAMNEAPADAPTQQAAPEDLVVQPAAAAPVPEQVDPQQLAAELAGLEPAQINDHALSQVATVPEAAELITTLNLAGSKLTPEGAAHVGSFKNLQSLDMRSVQFNPQKITGLGELQGLTNLSLASTPTDGSVLQQVGELQHLQTLSLKAVRIRPEEFANLTSLNELVDLDLTATPTNDAGVGQLVGLPLRRLVLFNTQVTDAGLAEIAKIKTLEHLDVAGTMVTGAGFKVLRGMELKHLNASGTNFGRDGLTNIKGIKSLEELLLFQARIIEHQKAKFSVFPNLRVLNLEKNTFTNQGFAVLFKGMKKIEELNLAHHPAVNDQGLVGLTGLKTLKTLNVRYTGITPEGAKALKTKIPDVLIQTTAGEF